MKEIILILLLPISCFAQKNNTGNIAWIDAKLDITLLIDFDYYKNGQLHWKGYMKNITDPLRSYTYAVPTGLWKYWYENGQIQAETVHSPYNKTKYINMWSSNGIQLLKDGQGISYSVSSIQQKDSMVYTIKDSLYNGAFYQFRVGKNNKYELIAQGNYVDNEVEGKYTFQSNSKGIKYEVFYKKNKYHGSYKRWNNANILLQKTEYYEGKAHGISEYYNKKGQLTVTKNFQNGEKVGEEVEYYSSGKVKSKGNYVLIRRIEKLNVIDPETFKDVIEEKEMNVSVKDGTWLYFAPNGRLTKKEIYLKGELKTK